MKSLIYGTDVTSAHSPLPKLSTFSINPKTDVAIINFSSGTSGLPKAVMISHYNILAFFEQLRSACFSCALVKHNHPPLIFYLISHLFKNSILCEARYQPTIIHIISKGSVQTRKAAPILHLGSETSIKLSLITSSLFIARITLFYRLHQNTGCLLTSWKPIILKLELDKSIINCLQYSHTLASSRIWGRTSKSSVPLSHQFHDAYTTAPIQSL